MNEKNILCICDTPLQLLNMINVIITYYNGFKYDLIITDEIKNYEILIKNIKSTNFFDNIYLVKEDFKSTVDSEKNYLKKISALFLYAKRIKKQHNTQKKYDKIFFWGTDWLNIFIEKQTKKSKNCEFIWVDEGTASYSTHGLFWKKNIFQRFVYLLNPYQIFKIIFGLNLTHKTSIQYLYKPEIADYNVPFKRKSIPLLNSDKQKADLFKKIFGFDNNNFIKEKYIYFDGAGDVDGLYGNDKELLNLVAECVGKENLLVKVHPRSSIDYYKKNGFHYNTNVSIPWEIYCLDQEQLKGKVLISIFSTAILSPYIYFGLKNKVVSLIEMFDNSSYSGYYKYLTDFIKIKIFKQNEDIYLLPKNLDELQNLLKQEI